MSEYALTELRRSFWRSVERFTEAETAETRFMHFGSVAGLGTGIRYLVSVDDQDAYDLANLIHSTIMAMNP